MKQIKHLIFGLRDVLFRSGPGSIEGTYDFSAPCVEEFRKLIAFARSLGIQAVVFANHRWTLGDGQDVQAVLDKAWGAMLWLTANGRSIPTYAQRLCVLHDDLAFLWIRQANKRPLDWIRRERLAATFGGLHPWSCTNAPLSGVA